MSNVQFDEDINSYATSRKILGEEVVPSMAKVLTKLGVAKSPRQALTLMITAIVVCIGVSVFFFIKQTRHPSVSQPPVGYVSPADAGKKYGF